jgi:sulfate adenylyltransferase
MSIAPHGGKLINRVAPADRADELLKRARTLKAVVIDDRTTSDLEMLGNGGLSPVEGFMAAADYRAVVRARPAYT